jgi:hypothetical protein
VHTFTIKEREGNVTRDRDRDHEPETEAPDQKNVVVAVDQAALEVAITKKETYIHPSEIRKLAEARGKVRKVILFTDEPRFYRGIHPLAADAAELRNRRLKEWYSFGFDDIHPCPRTYIKDSEEGLTKEQIDAHLIEGVRLEADMYEGREDHVRFIFVVSDEDYLPFTRMLYNKGFSVTVFITRECAFRDRMQAPHIEECLLLYEEKGKKKENGHHPNVVTPFRRHFGELSRVYYLDLHKKRYLDRVTKSQALCPICGEKTEIGLWSTHGCNENRYHLVPVLQTETGSVQHPYLTTNSDIQKIVQSLELLGAKQLLEWVIAQKACASLPMIIRLIFKRLRTIPWDAVEVAMGIDALGEDPMEIKEAKDSLTERALRLGCELDLIHVDGDEVSAREGALDNLAEFLQEAKVRSRYEHISRSIADNPTEGALTEAEINRRVFEESEQARLAEMENRARSIPEQDTDEILRLLGELSTDEILCWLADRSRVNRSDDEREAVKRALESGRSGPLVTWLLTLRAIETELDRPEKPLAAADIIARHAGAHMTGNAVAILIRQNVLRRHESGSYTKGHAAHPAFTSFKHLIDTAHPRVV